MLHADGELDGRTFSFAAVVAHKPSSREVCFLLVPFGGCASPLPLPLPVPLPPGLAKGKIMKDDAHLSELGLKQNQKFMMMGTPGDKVEDP